MWVRRFRNRASLPLEIGSARFHAELPANREFLIAVENVVSGPSGITCTITALDQEGRVLQVLDGVVVVEDAQLEGKFGTVERTGTATVSAYAHPLPVRPRPPGAGPGRTTLPTPHSPNRTMRTPGG